MALINPYITSRPLPSSVPTGPFSVEDLNRYLEKYYKGGAADPLNMKQSNTPEPNQNTGGITTAALGGISLLGDIAGMANQSLGLDTQAPDLQRSTTGEPVYTTGSFYNQASQAHPQGASSGEFLSGAAKGALAGAALGPVGAAVGGFLGGVGSLLGGRSRRKRQQAEKRKAIRSARIAQEKYNTASQGFDEQLASQSDYLNRMNNMNRLYNLYRL